MQSLPVAASFHPAEIFGDDNTTSTSTTTSSTAPSVDILVRRIRDFQQTNHDALLGGTSLEQERDMLLGVASDQQLVQEYSIISSASRKKPKGMLECNPSIFPPHSTAWPSQDDRQASLSSHTIIGNNNNNTHDDAENDFPESCSPSPPPANDLNEPHHSNTSDDNCLMADMAASLPVAASFHPAELFGTGDHTTTTTTTTPAAPVVLLGNFSNPKRTHKNRAAAASDCSYGSSTTATSSMLLSYAQSQFEMSPGYLQYQEEATTRAAQIISQGYPTTSSRRNGPPPLFNSSFQQYDNTSSNKNNVPAILSSSVVAATAAALEDDIGRRIQPSALEETGGAAGRQLLVNDDDSKDRHALLSPNVVLSAASTNRVVASIVTSGAADKSNNQEEEGVLREGRAMMLRQQQAVHNNKRPMFSEDTLFPVVLHRLLMDLESVEGGTEIAKFTGPHGKSFIVLDTRKFVSEVMRQYFPRMNHLSSFQRQLNLYNFARISGKGPDRGAYYHAAFVRDKPELASLIQRTKIKGRFTVPLEKRRKSSQTSTKKQSGSPPPSKESPEQPRK